MNVYETMLVVVSIAFICFCIAGVVITILQIAFEMRHEAKATPASQTPQTPPTAPRVPAAPQIISTTREVVDED